MRKIKCLLVSFFMLFVVSANLFAQSKQISANGVTIPDWMLNCTITGYKEYCRKERTIGQILSMPKDKVKLTKVINTDTWLSLYYDAIDDEGDVLATMHFEFMCMKYKNGGTCYVSLVASKSYISYGHDFTSNCYDPNNTYWLRQCLDNLKAFAENLFIDEVDLKQRKEDEEKLFSDLMSRNSAGYIYDEFLDFGKISTSLGEKYVYAVANRVSLEKGFTRCYYQEVNGKRVYDSSKWDFSNKVFNDEKATGFSVLDYRFLKRDPAYKVQMDAKRKSQRNKEDEEFVKKILTVEPLYGVGGGKIKYSDSDFNFTASGYKDGDGSVCDEDRECMILNKASIKAGFKPCYYQEQNGKRVFDTEKWQLSSWDYSKDGIEKSGTIKRDENANGFYFDVSNYKTYIYRSDMDSIYAKQAELKNELVKLISTRSLVLVSIYKSGLVDYGFYVGDGYKKICEKYEWKFVADSGFPSISETDWYVVLNKASEKAGYKPCYYQMQNGNRVFDTEKWQLGKLIIDGSSYDGGDIYRWEKSDTIEKDETTGGFYSDKNNCVFRNVSQSEVAELEKKKEEAQIAYEKKKKEEQLAYEKKKREEQLAVVKPYWDEISKFEVLNSDSSILRYEISLDKAYDYYNGKFKFMDSSGENIDVSMSDFLTIVKEITGQDYKFYGSSYIYRDATSEERAGYEKKKKEDQLAVVKPYWEKISKNGALNDNSGDLTYKIPLDNTYDYSYGGKYFTFKDSSGKDLKVSNSEL